jgi:hypothetical protein
MTSCTSTCLFTVPVLYVGHHPNCFASSHECKNQLGTSDIVGVPYATTLISGEVAHVKEVHT